MIIVNFDWSSIFFYDLVTRYVCLYTVILWIKGKWWSSKSVQFAFHGHFFFFDFTYIPEHVTKTKAGRLWPIQESGDFLNYGCSSHACGAVTPLIWSQVPYERRQAGLQLVDVALGQCGQGQKVHHVILSSQYHPSEWGSRWGMPGSQGLRDGLCHSTDMDSIVWVPKLLWL